MRRLVPALALTLAVAACGSMGGKSSQTSSASQPATSQSASAAAPAPEHALSADLVRDIQRRLGQQGYDVGPVDGVYGGSTQSALSNFQKDHNLRSTGQVDTQTLAALGIPGQNQAQAPAETGGYRPMNQR